MTVTIHPSFFVSLWS